MAVILFPFMFICNIYGNFFIKKEYYISFVADINEQN